MNTFGCAVNVDQTGLVTAISDGVATVTATHGALVAEAQVTVSLSLSSAPPPSTDDFDVGKQAELIVTGALGGAKGEISEK
jgi:uncharacterized protein YjdB